MYRFPSALFPTAPSFFYGGKPAVKEGGAAHRVDGPRRT